MNKNISLTSTRGLFCLSAALLLVGCGSGDRKKTSTIAPGSPSWVTQGSGTFKDGFYGVGSVTGVKDKSLAVSTANFRARAEIAAIVKTYVAELEKVSRKAAVTLRTQVSSRMWAG